jgi:DNA-binding GntR family transcriptional regulator
MAGAIPLRARMAATMKPASKPPSAARPPAGARTPGARHSTLNQLVTDAIRSRILAGEFAPGERLAEEQLSAELGVSRMPVREALRLLASEGIVTVRPRRGAAVTAYTQEQVEDLIEVRATLEGLNARLAARRHDPKHIEELERILRDGTKITERSELASIQRNNARFHEAIAAIAANSVLMGIVRSLRDRTALIFASQSRERVRENWKEHTGIVRAILAGNAELAERLASGHVFNAAGMTREHSGPKPPRARRASVRRGTES